jgi:DNA-binding CsgD family transcriptional regulator/tetratricopeptide (TPR) repeat protein
MYPRTTGELVGREGILRQLSDAFEHAASGNPTVVVVSGETGVGKTRLVTEFMARSEATTLAGACVPVAGEPLPYAALTQALRRTGGSGVVRQEAQRSPELARLLPQGAGNDLPGPDPGPGSGESSRLRLFQAVLGLLGRMSAQGPVVYVVEDLHWADRSTLDLLSFLATNLTDERVLLLLTYREDARDESRTLGPWLAELGRLTAHRIQIPRLDRADAVRMVTELAGQSLPPERLEETLDRSAGNPLFVEQLVLAGDGPGPLPSTLHELLRSRVEHLPRETRRLLRAAAVIGRVASVPLLARTVDATEEDVEDRLRVAIDAHVAEIRDDDSVGFHHPAFQEVVYAELLPGERGRLHRAAAEALSLETDPPPEVAGEVARHWHLAGDLDRALEASVAAGCAYEQMYAFSDAYASFGLALELLDRVPSSVDRVDLAKRAASSASAVGDSAAAVRLLEDALTHSEETPVRARLLERLGSVLFVAGDADASRDAFRSAMELLSDDDESRLAARVYAGYAMLAAAWSWLDDADVAGTRALRISRLVGGRREEGVTLNALGIVSATRGDLDQGIAQLREALEIAREVANPHDVGLAYVNLSHVLGLAGRLDDGIALCQGGIGELSRFGQDRQFGSLLLCNTSDGLIKAGRLAEAEELINEALSRHPRGVMAAPVLLFAARLTVATGDLTAAWERCEQARLVVEAEGAPLGWLREITETAVEVELWAGRPEAARELVADGLAAIAGTDEAVFGSALVSLGLRALADEAVAQRDHRSRTRRAGAREELLATLDGIRAVPGRDDLPESAALDLLCAAEQGRLDHTDAAGLWRDTAAAWTAIDRPLPAAYARWREAEALLSVRVGAESIGALRSVHTAAQLLGAVRLVEELETLARWYRVDLLPEVKETVDEDADSTALEAYALTAREREVLAALAAGHTNKEIADALFISVKTASVHVSNILRKLDVQGRQDAARVAHRLGVSPADVT